MFALMTPEEITYLTAKKNYDIDKVLSFYFSLIELGSTFFENNFGSSLCFEQTESLSLISF